jgi:hypothetical protein
MTESERFKGRKNILLKLKLDWSANITEMDNDRLSDSR